MAVRHKRAMLSSVSIGRTTFHLTRQSPVSLAISPWPGHGIFVMLLHYILLMNFILFAVFLSIKLQGVSCKVCIHQCSKADQAFCLPPQLCLEQTGDFQHSYNDW